MSLQHCDGVAAGATVSYTRAQLAAFIDHSVLLPQLTRAEARDAILLGRALGAASCCVRPCDVPLAFELLAGSATAASTVIGFPHGSTTTEAKVFEARQALESGAVELDLVINVARLRSGDLDYVQNEIDAVVAECRGRGGGAFVKVILECAYLSDEEKREGCRVAEAAGAAFVKTSTGFAVVPADKPAGATVHDLLLMRDSVSATVRVKAAGGVRTLDALLDVLAAGATRVGATATKAILDDFDRRAVDGVLTVIKSVPSSAALAPTSDLNTY
jgi:deoxyribose-phosphate aldolase